MYTVYSNQIQLDEEIKVSDVLKELEDLGKDHKSIKNVLDLYSFKDLIGTTEDVQLNPTEKLIRAMIKTYTAEACYRQIS